MAITAEKGVLFFLGLLRLVTLGNSGCYTGRVNNEVLLAHIIDTFRFLLLPSPTCLSTENCARPMP